MKVRIKTKIANLQKGDRFYMVHQWMDFIRLEKKGNFDVMFFENGFDGVEQNCIVNINQEVEHSLLFTEAGRRNIKS